MRWEWGEIETGQSGRWWDGSALGQDAGRIVRMSSGDRLDGWVRVRSCWGGDPQSCGHFRGSNWYAWIWERIWKRIRKQRYGKRKTPAGFALLGLVGCPLGISPAGAGLGAHRAMMGLSILLWPSGQQGRPGRPAPKLGGSGALGRNPIPSSGQSIRNIPRCSWQYLLISVCHRGFAPHRQFHSPRSALRTNGNSR